MRLSPFAANDADEVLADFGVDLVCVAVPSVTRGLYDFVRADDALGDGRVMRDAHVLKVKAHAFGTTRMQDTRITITDAQSVSMEFTIDGPLPQTESLFDAYALQPYRPRSTP